MRHKLPTKKKRSDTEAEHSLQSAAAAADVEVEGKSESLIMKLDQMPAWVLGTH